jgi:hypothetical protein
MCETGANRLRRRNGDLWGTRLQLTIPEEDERRAYADVVTRRRRHRDTEDTENLKPLCVSVFCGFVVPSSHKIL